MTYEEEKKLGAAIGYGQFLTVVVNFLIITFMLFIAIRQIETLEKPSAAAPTPKPLPAQRKVTAIVHADNLDSALK